MPLCVQHTSPRPEYRMLISVRSWPHKTLFLERHTQLQIDLAVPPIWELLVRLGETTRHLLL